MRGGGLPASGLTKLGQTLTSEERTAVAAMSAAVAVASGEVEHTAINALERLYDAFGLERRSLYAVLHQGAATATPRAMEPIVVERPAAPDARFRIPPPPPTLALGKGFTIDMARVSAVLRETREVAQVLAPIYEEDEAGAGLSPVVMPVAPTASRFRGLGADHSRLLEALCGNSQWSRADYQARAADFGLLPDGAIETINEWAYDELGDELIADGDPLTINLALLPEASEEAA